MNIPLPPKQGIKLAQAGYELRILLLWLCHQGGLFCFLGWVSVSDTWKYVIYDSFSQPVSRFFTKAVLNSIVGEEVAEYKYLEGGITGWKTLS